MLNSLRSNKSIFDVILSVAKILIYGEIDIQNEHKTEILFLFSTSKKGKSSSSMCDPSISSDSSEQNIWPALFPPL